MQLSHLPACLLLFLIVESFTTAELHSQDLSHLDGIYTSPGFTKNHPEVVRHFQKGMKMTYDIDLQVMKQPPATISTPYAVLGSRAALAAGRVSETDLAELSPGGYIIVVDDAGVVIAGPDSWGTAYGVYRFLEQVGMSISAPDFASASFSRQDNFSIPYMNRKDGPVFSFRPGRSLKWGQMFHQLGNPKRGADSELFDRNLSGSDLWVDHTAGYLVPKLKYYDSHPEFYARMPNGKRVLKEKITDHRTPLCLSQDEVVRISTERALEWIDNERNKDYFFVSYGDTGIWCQCQYCQQLDGRKGQHADRLLAWVNPVAEAVQAKYPEKTVLTFAYGGTDKPPYYRKPMENVWIVKATGLGNIPFWDHGLRSGKMYDRMFQSIDEWLDVAPNQVAVCEYQSNTYKPALVETLAARIRYYNKKGIRGIVFTYGVPRNFAGLWQYLLGRLTWDPNMDERRLAKEYVEDYFGNAAQQIWNILELYHRRYNDTLHHRRDLHDHYPEKYYSQEFGNQVLASFHKATQLVAGKEKLAQIIRSEERLFILDWLKHYHTDNFQSGKEPLERLLERLSSLAGSDSAERDGLARELHRIAIQLERKYPGMLTFMEAWILGKHLVVPVNERLPNGVRVTPQSFMFSGFGPAVYGLDCPPKLAAGVYVKGNSRARSNRMVAQFDWHYDLKGSRTELVLEGQVSSAPGLAPEIQVKINGAAIYYGPANFVENNWSLESIDIAPDILRNGSNIIEIINVSNPLSILRWNQRWCLFSKADIIVN